jgi:hypothetical protein
MQKNGLFIPEMTHLETKIATPIVLDTDPHWICIRVASWIRIRIRI